MNPTRPLATAALLVGLAAAGSAIAGPGPGHARGPGLTIDFAAIDTDGDGTLSRSELVAQATGRLSEADTSGDGVLDRDEIIAALPGPRGAFVNPFGADPAVRRADRMLAAMGATETGRITVADMASRQVDGLLARLDENRDGAVAVAEAEASPRRLAERGPRWHGDRGHRERD